ncbi:hypothetical protein BLA39750_03525 [Burkholderia lata]|uniref:Uncharacterized protein n=1 Tax=Burkholderia lata (strain ATCC 17760 / DSM 23089 / LMG 22485 / NCIMB 9086 / R18194 / 383) TaxID=482957 RepID=A0A6P2Y7G5_BURL3|nr:hypothetical protein BLA39750_03525 [Burkholderia lata]
MRRRRSTKTSTNSTWSSDAPDHVRRKRGNARRIQISDEWRLTKARLNRTNRRNGATPRAAGLARYRGKHRGRGADNAGPVTARETRETVRHACLCRCARHVSRLRPTSIRTPGRECAHRRTRRVDVARRFRHTSRCARRTRSSTDCVARESRCAGIEAIATDDDSRGRAAAGFRLPEPVDQARHRDAACCGGARRERRGR